MTIHKIIGEKGEMPHLCNAGSCPSAIIPAQSDEIFIQGYVPSESESSHLKGPAGEAFVRMPRAVFETIARQVLNS